jgi:hypothetical protein
MTRSSLFRTGLLVAAAAFPLAAYAAPATTMSPAQPAPAAATDTATPLPKAMAAKLDQHISTLHRQLAITPAQETQWQQFAQVMRDNAVAMHAVIEQRGSRMSSMNAADNMQSYAELARVHADNMQKLAASFQTLYASMDDSQKQLANTVFRNEDSKHESNKAG